MPDAALSAYGFWGKLPARGDFVGAGLPPDLVMAWDSWVSAGIAQAQAALGADRFFDAWMEAPVWRFSAGPGMFGAAPALGLWMPSADRAGRHFPLLLAAIGGAAETWLDAAEAAGRAALAERLDPMALAERLPAPVRGGAPGPGICWWTEGAPRVPPSRLADPRLPPADRFVAMLDAGTVVSHARG